MNVDSLLLELDSDLPTAMSAAVSAPLLKSWVQDNSSVPVSKNTVHPKESLPARMSLARLQLLDAADPSEPDSTLESERVHAESIPTGAILISCPFLLDCMQVSCLSILSLFILVLISDVQSTDSSPDDILEDYLQGRPKQDSVIHKQITPPPSASGISIASPSQASIQAEIKYQVYYQF